MRTNDATEIHHVLFTFSFRFAVRVRLSLTESKPTSCIPENAASNTDRRPSSTGSSLVLLFRYWWDNSQSQAIDLPNHQGIPGCEDTICAAAAGNGWLRTIGRARRRWCVKRGGSCCREVEGRTREEEEGPRRWFVVCFESLIFLTVIPGPRPTKKLKVDVSSSESSSEYSSSDYESTSTSTSSTSSDSSSSETSTPSIRSSRIKHLTAPKKQTASKPVPAYVLTSQPCAQSNRS